MKFWRTLIQLMLVAKLAACNITAFHTRGVLLPWV